MTSRCCICWTLLMPCVRQGQASLCGWCGDVCSTAAFLKWWCADHYRCAFHYKPVYMCGCVRLRTYVCRITISRFLEITKSVASHLWLIVSVQHYSLFYFLSFRVLTDGVLKKERYGFWIWRCMRYRRRDGAVLRTAGVTASEISRVNCSIECSVRTIMFIDFSSTYEHLNIIRFSDYYLHCAVWDMWYWFLCDDCEDRTQDYSIMIVLSPGVLTIGHSTLNWFIDFHKICCEWLLLETACYSLLLISSTW